MLTACLALLHCNSNDTAGKKIFKDSQKGVLQKHAVGQARILVFAFLTLTLSAATRAESYFSSIMPLAVRKHCSHFIKIQCSLHSLRSIQKTETENKVQPVLNHTTHKINHIMSIDRKSLMQQRERMH